MTKKQEQYRFWVLIISALVLAALAMYFAPIRQSRNFYNYADQRTLLGIPNFWNVITNLPFLIVGILGLNKYNRKKILSIEPIANKSYMTFFVGLIAIFFGSSYYHLVPDAFSLMLDRISLSVAFIALYCIVLTEYISPTLGQRLLFPLITYSMLAVLYWYISDTLTGRGDLSAYILVQVIPIVHLPLAVWLFTSNFSHGRFYIYALIAYALAKWAESNDDFLYQLTGEISGHSIKHLFAALGGFFVYWGLIKRSKLKKG
ncbi:hypothetical protein [uncultured Photobacterium sp.]|uniref:hypothetical protein n=1 Tax=uncultured Photobacterium sp. TaxID=173973 RepID=UPI0026094308|nr:hypothetical protein [uncultured Photobacterium sp.]